MNTESLIAWAAGFYDGEGSISYDLPYSIKLSVHQVRREPLDKFHIAVSGIGRIVGPYIRGRRPNQKPIYHYMCSRATDCWTIYMILKPYLCEPKLEQFEDVFLRYNSRPHKARGRPKGPHTRN
jgi:hypothetical protein